jgi:lysozyme family protein
VLDEATVTAKKAEQPTAKQAVVPTQAGATPTLRIKNESGKVEESTALNSNTYYDNVLIHEGGVSTDPYDLAAKRPENQDAPKTMVDGKERIQHTNKGVTYSIFKNWAKEKGIKQKDYHNRFLKLTDDETKDIVDSYTRSVGADKLESPALRAIFTQNAWGTGKVWASDFKPGRSPEYRAVLDWLQESTGMEFQSTGKMSAEEAKAIEEFYNKDPKGFIETYTKKKIEHLKTLDTFDKHGKGWTRRANELRDELIADL